MREESSMFKRKRRKFDHDLKRVFFFLFIALVLLFSSSLAVALEPPRAGEIEHLKQTGELSARLQQAMALGNHLIDPDLLERALYKAKRQALIQQGFSPDDILPAPPPAWKLMPTTGTVKVFALLIDFNDYPHYNSVEGINSALFGNGSLIPSNSFPYESLASYYSRSSYNLLNLSSGVTLGWYRPAYNRSSMAMTTTARETLIKEAITYFKGLGQDFSQFDNDGDGRIEYFIVIWTGPDNGWANFWWGYQINFSDQTFTVDGKTLGKYSWQWEYKSGSTYQGPYSPKTVMHETGHGLGLPDYYDYDPTVGPDGGVGGLDMMDGVWGDHNSFSKWVLEWVPPTVVATGSQSLTLNPSGTSQDAVLIMPGATSSDPFREFFIAQNRYRVGNDTGYPTDGMLIWHVDATLNASATGYLYNNSFTSRKLLKLMQADGLDRIENQSAWADAAMYYEPGKILTPVSNPSSKDYMGIDTRVNVTGISQAGQQMSATFSIDAVSTLATLNVTKSGAGSGTVTSVPDGISCGDDCAESYTPGTSVTLTAVPAAGTAFTGWSGGGCSGTGSCIVTISADVTVTANFDTTVILSENFDAQVLPSGWTTQINAGAGYWWFNYPNYNNTGGSGGCALGATYSTGPYDIELRTKTFNLSSFNNVGLEFKTGIAASGSTADVDMSVNGSAGPWTTVWKKIGLFTGPQTVNVDLSSVAAGNSNIMLRFRTYGTGIWWVIDDVKVMASTSNTPPDTTPPTPNPMTWATSPYGASSTSTSMVATTATDAGSPPVSYYFHFVSSPTGGTGGSDAGWQSSTSYTNTGLQANHQYGYQVKARDSAPTPNETAYSSAVYKYTLANAPGASSFSNVTQTSIRANWTANGNRSGTEYWCENTTQGTNSGWTTNTYWDSTGLTAGTSYTFRVKARNGDLIETGWTNLGSQSTQAADTTAPPAPISLGAVPGSWTNTNSFSIDWTNPSDPSGIAGAYYKLGSAPTSNTDGTYTTSKPFTVAAGAQGGQVLYVWLKDGAGNTDYNNRSSTTLYYDGTAPSDGTLSATPGNAQVSLSWSGFSDSGGSGLRSTNTYKVVRSTGTYPSSQCTSGTQVYLGSDGSTTDPGLTNGTTYYYRACAYDNAGNVSQGATALATPTSGGPIIRVISPNGGEIWTIGSTYAITWTSSNLNPAGGIYIFYWYNDWQQIAGPLLTSSTSYSWTVPDTPTTSAWIFVGNWFNNAWEVSDQSDNGFTIEPKYTLFYVSKDGVCGGKTPCYTTIQNGIDDTTAPTSIIITQETYNENVILDFAQTIELQGGWNSDFSNNSGQTTINGSLTISNGKVIINKIILQ